MWQVLPFTQGPGADHMARDEALLTAHLLGQVPSTFYLSRWDPAALSVGYHQRHGPVTAIRRPTGGRAVWHGGDVTYTLVTSGLVGSVLETYQQLSQVLVLGLGTLGVPLAYGGYRGQYRDQVNCFALETGADLCWQGHKVIGSAQLRRGGAILQQGSILEPDYPQLERLFPGVPLKVRGLHEILGRGVDLAELEAAIHGGIKTVFG